MQITHVCSRIGLSTHICRGRSAHCIPSRVPKTHRSTAHWTRQPERERPSATKTHSHFSAFRSLLFRPGPGRVAVFFLFRQRGQILLWASTLTRRFGFAESKIKCTRHFVHGQFWPGWGSFFSFLPSLASIPNDRAAFKWTIDEMVLHIIIQCGAVCLRAFGIR